MTKNVSNTFDVNNVPLEELESYDLYLWLTDVDGGQEFRRQKGVLYHRRRYTAPLQYQPYSK